MTEPKRLSPATRAALNIGPLAVFLGFLLMKDIYVATGVFMATMVAAVGIEFYVERRVSPMLGITAVLALVMGGLTLYLHDPRFVKMKPTVAYVTFAAALAGGLAIRQNIFKQFFESTLHLSDEHWRILTWRWVAFFVAMAVANELVWRNASDATWASYKLFGALPATFLFAASQIPFMLKHHHDDTSAGTEA
ncbi:MAG TPA: septation protein A [Rhizomicrobium sp.]